MAESNHPTLEILESQAADLRKTLDNLTEMNRKGLPVAEAIAKAQEQLTAINGQIAYLQRDETTPSVIFSQPQQQPEHQTNIGEMNGGIAQPDSEFRGNVQQAGRDIRMRDHYQISDLHCHAEKLPPAALDEQTALTRYLDHIIESNRRLQL